MDIAYYNEYLTDAIEYFLLCGVVALGLLIVFLFVAWILRIIAKYKLPKEEMRKVFFGVMVIVTAIGCYLLDLFVVPAAKDLKYEDYIEVHGELERYSRRGRGIVAHSYGVIRPDEQEQIINLTFVTENNDKEKIPVGKYTGTVIYARRSRIVLDFIPDS